MKLKIINKIKYSPIIFKWVNRLGNILFLLIKHLIPVNEKKIIFVSYGGKSYSDSPRIIFEKMIKEEKFSEYSFIWALNDITKIQSVENNVEVVKIDTLTYFFHVLSSKYWVTNVSVERSFKLKKKNQIYCNTWHGTPLKKMGIDIPDTNESFQDTHKMEVSHFFAQTEYEKEIFSRVFKIEKEVISVTGLPRNDTLTEKFSNTKLQEIKKSLNIPLDKKVILYAPTYREYNIQNGKYDLSKSIEWISKMTEDFFVLVRAHYEVVSMISENISSNNNLIDVGSYDNLNNLIQISDLLISDYSSLIIDYSITEKPIILYTYDFEEYESKRGLYFDIRNYLPSFSDSDSLVTYINLLRFEKFNSKSIKEKLEIVSGDSVDKVIKVIFG